MHTVREGDEGESVGDRSKVRPERVGGAAHVPADPSRRYACQDYTCPPRSAHRGIDTVQVPHRQQSGDAAPENPDHVPIEHAAS